MNSNHLTVILAMFIDFAQRVGKYTGIVQMPKLMYPNTIGEYPLPTKTFGYVLTGKEVCFTIKLVYY